MDALDAVMNELARGRDKPTKSGGSWRKAKNDAAAEACVHYLKNREIYRTFLTDARVPPATDLFEGRIRPAALLYRNADLLDDALGGAAVAAALSLTRTLRFAGTDAPAQWRR